MPVYNRKMIGISPIIPALKTKANQTKISELISKVLLQNFTFLKFLILTIDCLKNAPHKQILNIYLMDLLVFWTIYQHTLKPKIFHSIT